MAHAKNVPRGHERIERLAGPLQQSRDGIGQFVNGALKLDAARGMLGLR
jgi:hypothetical protein